MSTRAQAEGWIRRHRKPLLAGWLALGAAVLSWLALIGPDVYYLRGIAPWPRRWAILFFLSIWGWAGLRFIALWIWAWVVLALAPVFLFVPLRFHLDAWWLMPLLASVVAVSALTVLVVLRSQRRRRTAAGTE